tara:strand:+ start:855 stop:1445 length:591 start_codon:yes stop_codon:yes gene_type:complete
MLETLINSMLSLNYSVFTHDTKPFNLNIVGVRSDTPKVNEFNDNMFVFWKYKGYWNYITMQCTTLPGLKYLETPINPAGCAILVPGQYRSTYALDLHNSKYMALCQRLGNVSVYRDDNEDQKYDMNDMSIQTGEFGINIHRADKDYEVELVNGYSAGCQVIENPSEYDIFINICEKSEEYWGNSFTYTLLTESQLV